MKNIGIISKSGLTNYILVRISAVIALSYITYLTYFFLFQTVDYYSLVSLFSNSFFKVYTICAFIAISIHAWIGMWQVVTDYIKSTSIKKILILSIVLGSVCYSLAIFIILGDL